MLEQQHEEEQQIASFTMGQVSSAPSVQSEVEVPLELMNTMRVMLNSGDKKVRQEAVGKLLARGRQGMEILIRVIDEDKSKRKTRIRNGVIIYCSVIAFLIVLEALFHLKIIGGLIGGLSTIITMATAATVAQKQSALALAQIEDKRAVPYLLEALDYGEKEVKANAELALKKLLPTLVFEDEYALHFTAEHHKYLNKLLKSKDTELVLATLNALEQVGDETAVEPVGDLMAHTKTSAEVKVAAQQCLIYLKANAERFKDARSLLRASSVLNIPNAELLRPAQSGDTTPQEELLRPLDAGDAPVE